MESSSKVVLDTNIFISALIHPGKARDFVYLLLERGATIIISSFIINEVEEVLARSKFQDKKIFRDLWQLIKKEVEIVEIKPLISSIILRDPEDHPILQTAEKGGAKYIITGDDDLLEIAKWKDVNILSMNQFKNLLK